VILTAQEEDVFEAPAAMEEPGESLTEDMALSKVSAAPQVAKEESSTLSETKSLSETRAERLTTAASKDLIAPKKKRRNPDVRKLSQTQQLMKLLRPEGSAQ
jgi:hypothetical protein